MGEYNKRLYSEYEFRKIFINHTVDKQLFLSKYFSLLENNKGNIIELNNYSGNMLYIPKRVKCGTKGNILIVSHELSRTGAPIVAFDTAKLFIKEGYNVLFVSPTNGYLLNDLLKAGIPTIIMKEISYYQYLFNDIDLFKEKLDLDILVDSFDKVLFNTATLYEFIKRYMNDYNNIYWWIHEGKATYDGLAIKMPKYINPNVKVLCVGEYASKQLDLYGFHYNQKLLNYGVKDYGLINKKSKNKKIVFLNVGTVGVRKGQHLLIEAIKKLPKDYFNKCEFLFIGDCNDNDPNEFKVKNEILELTKKYNNVKYYTSFPRNKLFDIYNKIDVLTVTSNDDPMPVVATENFMLGNAVLCSTNTGTSYYVEDNKSGYIFKSGSVNSLKNKLECIIDNPKRLPIVASAGRNIYETNFDMEYFKDNVFNLVIEGDK